MAILPDTPGGFSSGRILCVNIPLGFHKLGISGGAKRRPLDAVVTPLLI